MKKVGNFWVPDAETHQIAELEAGGWQLDHLDEAIKHVRDCGVGAWAVDGGAHVGSWTLHMAERGFSMVKAFEPSPDTFECLYENAKEWRIANMHRQVSLDLNKCALGAEPGKVSLKDDGRYAGGNTGGRHIDLKKDGDINVRALDVYGLPALDFLKLDLEGFELFALRGARETLIRTRPVVMLEVKHRMAHRYGYQPGAPSQFLFDLGMIELGHLGSDFIYGWP